MSVPVRRLFLLTTALATGVAGPAAAQQAASAVSAAAAPATPAVECPAASPCLQPDGTVTLDTVVISATRTEEAPIAALGGVTVIDPESPQRAGSRRVADLFQATPGVATDGAGDESGAAINIRGLQDFGRVAVMVDGARQDFQQTTHRASGTFFLDPALVDRVTVVRGPIANVYGSGAIGGVVAFETIDPTAFLREGETWAVQGRTGFASNSSAPTVGSTAAYRVSDQFAVLGSLNYAKSHAYEDGHGDEVYNSGEEVVSGLGKAELQLNDFNTLTASYLGNQFDYVTGDAGATQYDTSARMQTASARWTYDNPDDRLFNIRASGYWTGTDKRETRIASSSAALIGTERNFDIDTFGFDLANTSHLDTGGLSHEITVGADGFRDAVESSDPNGTGAFYTPGGDRLAYGAFLQDQLRWSDWLKVTGGLRFDGYKLTGTDGDGNDIDSSGTRLSPKIALGLTPFEGGVARGLELYTSYAEGYRAPSTTETLISGIHPGTSNFEFRPNANLTPETAHTIEVGVNYTRDDLFTGGDRLRLKAGYFHNSVDDYIDGYYGFDTSTFSPYYQYQNVAEATIQGVEFEAAYDMGRMFFGLSGALMQGDNEETGEALTTIPAARLTTSVGFRFLDDRLTVGAEVEAVAAQDRVPDGSPTSGGYGLVNLFASYQPTEDLSLGLRVDNLFDKQYTEYLDEDPSAGLSVMFTLSARLGG